MTEIRHQFLSAERARTVLNWRPQFTLESGLDRTLAWYRELLRAPAAMDHKTKLAEHNVRTQPN